MLKALFNKSPIHKGYSFFNPRYYSQTTEFVRVNTIDHDGCFGLQYMEPHEVSIRHGSIIEALGEQKKSNRYTIDYVMSYSNRQSIRRDCYNAIYNQNNLAFPVATALAAALNAYFDPLLLADIYAEKKPGFTVSCMKFALAKKGLTLRDNISDDILTELLNSSKTDFVFSEDKINILYPQMHRMALIHPRAMIHFHIYDDLIEQVLHPSIAFYAQYQSLIPRNITLHFHHFNTLRDGTPSPINISAIAGKGDTDDDYYKTVMVMGEIAKREEGDQITKYKMANYLSPKKILGTWSEMNMQSKHFHRG